MKIYIVVTDDVNDVTYSRKSFNTRVFITLLLHDIIHWKTATSYEPHREKTGFLPRRKQRRRSASR